MQLGANIDGNIYILNSSISEYPTRIDKSMVLGKNTTSLPLIFFNIY